MKTIFKILLLSLISFEGNSQTTVTTEIKISKQKLSDAKSVKEIISEIPADCLITSFECSANLKEGIATVTNNSDNLNAVTKNILNSLTLKNKFFISNIKSNCSAKLKKEYSFVITE